MSLSIIISCYFLFVSYFVIRSRVPLFIFLYFISAIQFFPVVTGIFSSTVVFWPREDYIINTNTRLYNDIVVVFGVMLSGFAAGTWYARFKSKNFELYKEHQVLNRAERKPDRLFFWVAFIVSLFIIPVFTHFELYKIFPGTDLVIPSIIIFLFVWAISSRSNILIFLVIVISAFYIAMQAVSGDRNWANIVVGLTVYIFSIFKLSKLQVISAGTCFLVFLAFAVFLSINRLGIDLTLSGFMSYLFFNSWVAVLKPLIDLLRDEGISPVLLFGETYFAMALSFAPSPFYSMLGIEKPYNLVAPSFWYPKVGGGGMHATGVALKNFGLIGIFLQTAIYSIVSVAINFLALKKNTFLFHFLLALLAGAYMRAIWYDQINFVNALFFYFFIIFGIYFTHKLIKGSGC